MPIHIPAPVSDEPVAELSPWRVIEVRVKGTTVTRHFMGFNHVTMSGRVSSPIEEWDPIKHEGVTASGRVYKLKNQPKTGMEIMNMFHIWDKWMEINGIEEGEWADVTQEYTDDSYD
jgi:hypothetical protein